MNIQEGAEVIRSGGLVAVQIKSGAAVIGLATTDGLTNVLQEGKSIRDRYVLIDSERRAFQVFDDIPEIAWDLLDQTGNQLILELSNPKGIDVKWLELDGALRIKFLNNLEIKKMLNQVNKPVICFRFNHIDDVSAHLNTEEYVLNLQADLPDEGMQMLPIIKLDESANIQILRS